MGTIFNQKIFKGVSINGKIAKGLAKNGVVFWESIDPEVENFITKAGLTNKTEKIALNNCFVSLKQSGLILKIRVFYPMLGGTSDSTKFDFIATNNNSYNIDWFGGVTFSNQGVKGNGVNAYGNTKFLFTSMDVNSHGMTIVLGDDFEETAIDPIVLGSMNSPSQAVTLGANNAKQIRFRMNSSVNSVNVISHNNIYTFQRIVNKAEIFIQSIKTISNDTSGTLPNRPLFILNMPYTGGLPYATGYTQHRLQSILIHEALTDLEVSNLNAIITQFETDLGRKTW